MNSYDVIITGSSSVTTENAIDNVVVISHTIGWNIDTRENAST